MKSFVYRFSPGVLRSLYQRIEASPLGYRLAKGAFWSLAGSLVSRGLGLFASVLVGRMLGVVEFGELGIIQSTIGMFGALAGFGMGLTAIKYVAEFKHTDPTRAGRIIGLSSAAAWASSGVLAIALFTCAPWLATNALAAPHLAGLLRISTLLLLLGGINGAQTGALSGFEAFRQIARINLIAGLLTFPLIVFGTWQWGVTGAVWGLVGSQLANCVMCALAVRAESARHKVTVAYVGSWDDLTLFCRFSLPAILTGLLNTLVTWGAGVLVVNQAGGYAEMGVYNAALRVKLLPETFLAMLIAPMLPILSEAFGKGDRSTFQRTLLFNFLLAALIIVPVSLVQVAAPALTLMPFGVEYQGHPDVVIWLMLHAIMYALLFPMSNVLVSIGRMWFSLLVNVVFVALLGIGTYLSVPQYGVVGYLVSMVIAFAAANVPCVVFLYRQMSEMIRFLRWGLTVACTGLLFLVCLASFNYLTFRWSTLIGLLAAAVFILLIYRLQALVWAKT